MNDPQDSTAGEAPSSSMRIGEVAARTDLSLRSLRHWEEVGLIRPSARSEGGYRLYSEGDVQRILVIRRMKPLGFTLEEMTAVMRDIETVDDPASNAADHEARRRLEDVRSNATERRAGLVEQLAMADEFIELMGRQLD